MSIKVNWCSGKDIGVFHLILMFESSQFNLFYN